MATDNNQVCQSRSHRGQPRGGMSRSVTKRVSAFGVILGMAGAGLMLASPATAATSEDGPMPGGWSPNVTKVVAGAKVQSGPNADKSIEGLGVWQGQSAKYEVGVDLAVPDSVGEVQFLEVHDQLPAGFEVNEKSLAVYDSRKGSGAEGDESALVAAENYEVSVSESGELIVAFTPEWIAQNVGGDAEDGRLAITFEVKVAEDAADYSAHENTASQIFGVPSAEEDAEEGELDYYEFNTEPATILVPGVEPSEQVLGADGEAVGDRIAVGGDQLTYQVALDGTFGQSTEDEDGNLTPEALELAYDIQRFGIVDDFDEGSLDVKAGDVRVLDASGADVTDKFEIGVRAGVLTVTAIADGPRDSVPVDLLGQDYTVEYTATVKDVKEATRSTGETVQVIDDREHPVEAESQVFVEHIAPTKNAVSSVVVDADGNVTGGDVLTEVPRGEFSYKLGSSAVPANPLSPVTGWSLSDVYTSGDRSLHDTWSVVATTALSDEEGNELFAAGDVIADQDNTDYFELRPEGDSYSVAATEAFIALIGDQSEQEHGWEVNVAATRVAEEGTRVSNTGYELRNGVERAATVTTGTAAGAPVEELPVPEDPEDGDDGEETTDPDDQADPEETTDPEDGTDGTEDGDSTPEEDTEDSEGGGTDPDGEADDPVDGSEDDQDDQGGQDDQVDPDTTEDEKPEGEGDEETTIVPNDDGQYPDKPQDETVVDTTFNGDPKGAVTGLADTGAEGAGAKSALGALLLSLSGAGALALGRLKKVGSLLG